MVENHYIYLWDIIKGGFSSKSSVLTSYDMEKLMTFVHNKIGELGHQIIDGCIDVNPYIKISPGGGMSNGKHHVLIANIMIYVDLTVKSVDMNIVN